MRGNFFFANPMNEFNFIKESIEFCTNVVAVKVVQYINAKN